MTGLLLDSFVESRKGPLKASRRGNKEASGEQKRIDYEREEREEVNKIHSIAWDVKTRAVEEIQYTEV